jgi:hydrophobe/amphiphile efflux-3 (HAE3) family protein
MILQRLPRGLAGFIAHNPLWIILAIVLLTAALAPGITLLQTETGFDTMLSPDNKIFRNTDLHAEEFGGEPVVILIKADCTDTVFSPSSIALLSRFEQEFSPEQDQRVYSIFGPIDMLEMARAEASEMGMEFEIDDPVLIHGALYQENGEIRPEMAPLIPSPGHALINLRPMGNLEYKDSIQLIHDIDDFFSRAKSEQEPANIEAVVVADIEMMETITNGMVGNLSKLLIGSIAMMAIILLLMFRVRWNLISLFMVGIAAFWTFGIMGYMGVPLSMSSMAVMPILIGIGIDYSIQFHNRYQEEVAQRRSVRRAIIASITRMFPVVTMALIATIIGFVTLFISEVPMVQDFGKNLAIGVVISFLLALFLLNSILHVGDRRVPIEKLGKSSKAAIYLFERALGGMARIALKNPIPILLIAAIVAIVGAVVDHRLPSKVDHEEMMPKNSSTLKDMQYLRSVTGYSGELHFSIVSDDVTIPQVLEWMRDFQDRMMEHYNDSEEIIKRIASPAKIISDATGGTIPKEQEQIDQILANTPLAYVEQVVSADRKMASLSFGMKYMPVEETHSIFQYMLKNAQPPDDLGLEIVPVGNMAMGSKAVDAMLGKRFMMNIMCLGAIFAVLIIVYRRITRAFLTIIPVGIVIGWASFGMWVIGLPLNTMTSVLGVLIIGVGTEFIVLLLGRYEEEKQKNGSSPHDAMVTAIAKTGRAIVTTALTTLGGFAILIISDFTFIRDFGVATTVGVFLCLVSSLVVMPPLVVWWDTRVTSRLPEELRHKV